MRKFILDGVNSAKAKKNNIALILNIIREHESVSRSELSRITGLSKGGLTPIIQELIACNIIRETGIINSASGRKPVMLQTNSEAGGVIAVDFGRLSIKTAFINFGGEVTSFHEFRYLGEDVSENIIKKLKSMIRFFIEENSDKKVLAIGVSVPGPLDSKEGRVLLPPEFRGALSVPLKEILEKEFDIKVFIDKDANANAMAEKIRGKGRLYDNFIHITQAEGIGMGIIVNGELYKGRGGEGAEAGHISICREGRKCSCGNYGCLEMYASITAIIEDITENLKKDQIVAGNALKEAAEQKLPLDFKSIEKALLEGSKLAEDAFIRAGEFLGDGIVSLINVFAPDAVIIHSCVKGAEKYMKAPLIKKAAERTIFRNNYVPDIIFSDIAEITLLGMADIVFSHIINEYLELLMSL